MINGVRVRDSSVELSPTGPDRRAPLIPFYSGDTRWLKHLNWLNANLACAHSISLTDAKGWLSDLKATSAP
jgi:hypothetical protein